MNDTHLAAVLKPSAAQRQRTKLREGCSLTAYPDGPGGWSIGYGHYCGTRKPDDIDQKQAEYFFDLDITRAACAVRANVEVPLTQGQFDALVDFTFNEGPAALKTSTLLRKLNAGDYDGALDEFPRWVFAQGDRLEALEQRREEEMRTWQAGTPEANRAIPADVGNATEHGTLEWWSMNALSIAIRLATALPEMIRVGREIAAHISSDDDAATKLRQIVADAKAELEALEKAIEAPPA